MKKRNTQITTPTSLLNRLIESSNQTKQHNRLSERHNFDMLCKNLCRDLESLLNSRARCLSWPKDYKELEQSVLAYGLPDFTAMYFTSELSQQELCIWVQTVISNFEPRFKKVSVTAIEDNETDFRIFRMRIKGIIYTHQEPQEIALETIVEPDTLSIQITENE